MSSHILLKNHISFTYKKIKWTWEPNGIESEDSWEVPK